MTFEYTDPYDNRLQADPGDQVVALTVHWSYGNVRLDIPLARVEEVVAGIRDTARQTGACGCGEPATPNVVHRQGAPCYMDQDGGLQTVELPERAARQTGQQPDETVPTPEEGIEDARKVMQHVLQLFLDRVPREELDAETMADSLADALSDGLTELYRTAARATPAAGPVCGNEYDGEECELEPGHPAGHRSGNLAWSYGRTIPAAGLDASQSATDRAAVLRELVRLAIAKQWLDETGSGRTVDELDDAEFGTLGLTTRAVEETDQ